MIPEEEQKTVSDQAQSPPAKGFRRSRRGGRRHSRRRGPRPPAGEAVAPDTGHDAAMAPAEPTEEGTPAESAPTPSDTEVQRRHRAAPAAPKRSGIAGAIEQVTEVIDEMKHALDEMEEVLETLELAERQKIEDEREIESLQRALRQLHRPGPGGNPPRHSS